MAKEKNAGISEVVSTDNTSQSGFWARLTEDAWANLIGGTLIAGVLVWVWALPGGKPASPVYACGLLGGKMGKKKLRIENTD